MKARSNSGSSATATPARAQADIALLDGKPGQEGAFTLYRLPHGGAAMRLNACSRFRSSEMSVAPYPVTRLKAPGA